MGIVYKPLPVPTADVELRYWYKQATGRYPAEGVDPRALAMRAYYQTERGRAVETMARQGAVAGFGFAILLAVAAFAVGLALSGAHF